VPSKLFLQRAQLSTILLTSALAYERNRTLVNTITVRCFPLCSQLAVQSFCHQLLPPIAPSFRNWTDNSTKRIRNEMKSQIILWKWPKRSWKLHAMATVEIGPDSFTHWMATTMDRLTLKSFELVSSVICICWNCCVHINLSLTVAPGLRKIARVPRSQMSDRDIQHLFAGVDSSNNGRVNAVEFVQFMNLQMSPSRILVAERASRRHQIDKQHVEQHNRRMNDVESSDSSHDAPRTPLPRTRDALSRSMHEMQAPPEHPLRRKKFEPNETSLEVRVALCSRCHECSFILNLFRRSSKPSNTTLYPSVPVRIL